MGKGRKGMENVIQAIRRLPKRSRLLIAWDIVDRDPQAPPYVMPYEALDMHKEYFDALKESL
ncbi:MAG TPA: hypothetical protein VLJ39_18895, partial [Tepidisphaeraceae bacterium]|nr:hypothetical protein [Tepidisphaeraceae bacterium]